MELREGYKQTEVGAIPVEWEVKKLGEVVEFANGKPLEATVSDQGEYFLITLDSVGLDGRLKPEHRRTSSSDDSLRKGDIVIILSDLAHGNLLGQSAIISEDNKYVLNQRVGRLRCSNDCIPQFVRLQINFRQTFFRSRGQGTSQRHIYKRDVDDLAIPLPSKSEQQAIAAALSDVDVLIAAQDALIAKKRDMKQGAMQQLLSGKKRLGGFGGAWETKTLFETTECLDNLRVPLNEGQRSSMRGDYPYCGANGILDYIDGYLVDDDIILIAEDGGYFDEFQYRPIAYRMSGKCWINNHAHILKAKPEFDQAYIFYSLEHKNILPFLAVGTRSKLNKGEMYRIQVAFPSTKEEQQTIAQILGDMDAEIEALELQRAKHQLVKQGMMQELLTGKTRLV